LGVHLPLNLAPLTRCTTRVLNNLGVFTGEDDDTDNPSSVLQDAATQQRSLEIDGVDLVLAAALLTVENDSAVQPEHVDLWRIEVDTEMAVPDGIDRAKVS
jgi:hypothetical protein